MASPLRFRAATAATRATRAFSSSARTQTAKDPLAPPPGERLNRYSYMLTHSKTQGASQAMLYATDSIDQPKDLERPMVGIANVWYEGNPCNKHVLTLGTRIKDSLTKSGITGYGFGTPAVSDGISMGTFGMSYSLQSRDLIADAVETVGGGHWLDGMVTIPACDKNMPGVLMALGRLNRPGLMVYGGTMQPGSCGAGMPSLDVVSAFQSYGKYLEMGETEEAERVRLETVRNSCRKEGGACGGMYTANTMASAAEAMGMTLPGSSSTPTAYKEKQEECDLVGPAMLTMLERNIRPRDIMTRAAFENALVLTMILGGSTNAVLHLIAIAKSVGIELTIDDVQSVSDRVPFLADLKPSGKYVMEDLHKVGGVPAVLKYLLEHKLIDGDIMTVNGRQLGDNLDRAKPLKDGQDVVRPLSDPIKSTGHLRILKGNIAPGGCVSKITGKEGLTFRGKARVFDNEDDVTKAIETKSIKQGEKTVIVLRYLGPKGGPGMPEMLKTTSMVMGAGLGLDVACVTDGRFSGGTHGFTVGHVVPEAFNGGNIALIEDGDEVYIDAVKNTIDMKVSDEELAQRREKWVPREPKVKSGALYKYIKLVSDASHGAVTDA
ncbi:hypothetical protein BMF94_5998 [Rhodotorula taiwanensis]|uniref:dihydroxy-acid dehydratase n=1 Tax=Rhodotorula taiwanensis TaxID=741276 RepID=A0A2S5B2Q5_9BASI|nr:hypothetical protein BMF94_5998 [Rhodotorula taiwanensis]